MKNPRKLKHHCDEIQEQLDNTKRELYNAQQREAVKLEQNLPSLLVTEAENEKLITSEARGVLSTFTNLPVELFSKKSCAYGEEQWQFVATLHYYSPKAYNFFRK